jgi:hypothetical protein
MAFIVFLTFIIVVKIRQEFFLIESAPIDLFKNHNLNSTFFIPERSAALSVFVKRKDAENFQIYFEEGESFLWPKEEELFNKYLDKRRKSIVYMAMLMRINSEKNSRVKVLTEREVQFDDIQAIMKIFSQFGFDSFEGLPEDWIPGWDKGKFHLNGFMPSVPPHVTLIKGWFNETVPDFIKQQNKKVSFVHMDADLYSSTKCVLDALKDYFDTDCVLVFDELLNYPGFDSDKGELKALYEFITENNVNYSWIGMNGSPDFNPTNLHQPNLPVAIQFHSIGNKA